MLQNDNELEEDLLDNVQSCLGAVLEQFGDTAMPLMESLMPQIGQMLTPKSSVFEKRVGICIMDDIMEHTQEGDNPAIQLNGSAMHASVLCYQQQSKCSNSVLHGMVQCCVALCAMLQNKCAVPCCALLYCAALR